MVEQKTEVAEGDVSRAREANERRAKSAPKLGGYLKEQGPWAERFLGLLLLSPACVLAALFWRVPVADPLTVSALLVDRVLLASTALLLPVCVLAMVAAPWPWARRGAVAGAIVAVALGGSTSLASLRPPVDRWPTVLAVAALAGGIGLLLWTRGGLLLSWRGAIPIALVLSLLPLVQFWHATSFVPARLNTTLGADVHVTGHTTKLGNATGEVEVVVRNNGEVGALILASELILCYRPGPHEFLLQNELYEDPHCETEQLFDNLSQIDSHSTWTIRHAFHRSAEQDSKIRVVQGIVFLWYARMDRLRVDSEPLVDTGRFPPLISIPIDHQGCRNWTLLVYGVEEESRFQGVVQRDRRMVYLRDPNPEASGDAYVALTTVGEPLCNPDGDKNEMGLPRWSDYDLDQRIGLTTLRLNHEEWLELPNGK